jgi:NAD(P)-dependent dehydrogenase (short-subunit alcohol dehydrogenase family)
MHDKVTLITGAAKGIGRGIARVFNAEDATLVIADIDAEVGEATAAELAEAGAVAEFV